MREREPPAHHPAGPDPDPDQHVRPRQRSHQGLLQPGLPQPQLRRGLPEAPGQRRGRGGDHQHRHAEFSSDQEEVRSHSVQPVLLHSRHGANGGGWHHPLHCAARDRQRHIYSALLLRSPVPPLLHGGELDTHFGVRRSAQPGAGGVRGGSDHAAVLRRSAVLPLLLRVLQSDVVRDGGHHGSQGAGRAERRDDQAALPGGLREPVLRGERAGEHDQGGRGQHHRGAGQLPQGGHLHLLRQGHLQPRMQPRHQAVRSH
mmetsp:Transcript_4361/g.9802  ORF Transcript_4361/g.9802 Transcript_4361/m.9802 type:complete len:258 (+) Transcript_4361:2034-2807(+)